MQAASTSLTRPRRFVIAALLVFVAPLASVPGWAADPAPITVGKVFQPDLADIGSVAAGSIKQAADQIGGGANAGGPVKDSCAAPAVTVTAMTGADTDAGFANALGQARADALQTALTTAGLGAGTFATRYAIGPKEQDGSVTVSSNSADTDAPKLRVTSGPAKDTKVKAGDTIAVTISASERYADGHKSRPSGVAMIQLVSNTGGVVYAESYPNPEPCAVPTLQVTYTVPDAPPPVIVLTAIARDAAGNQGARPATFRPRATISVR